jgi:hypothetical protein
MPTPLRNEAVEHNTREAFRCLKQWQIFATVCWIIFFVFGISLIVIFWPR